MPKTKKKLSRVSEEYFIISICQKIANNGIESEDEFSSEIRVESFFVYILLVNVNSFTNLLAPNSS